MPNWSSLQPLKVHSTLMAIVVLVLTGILFLTPRHVFKARGETSFNESKNIKSSVRAISGLSIRSKPNVSGALLITAPYHATLTIIDEDAAPDIIGGQTGKWHKVEYSGVIGYAWGNYIDK